MAAAKKDLAAFRAAHDRNVIVPEKIKKALQDMEKEGGSENWEYEQAFIKRSGLSQTDIGAFRDQFAAHVVETTGRTAKRVWVATAKAAEKFRAAVG